MTNEGATRIEERRRDLNVILGFLAVVFLIAGVRGASGAPALAVVMGVLFVATAAFWMHWRRSPASAITITADEITFGRPEKVVTRIPRSAAPLRFRRNAYRQTGWWLATSQEGAGAISMIGFDPGSVRDACLQHGWDFER